MITSVGEQMAILDDERAKRDLQNHLQDFFDVNHSILVSNGTVAIEVVLKALPISRGACVIVPDISFIATATAVANVGLVPVYADVSESYFGITLNSVKQVYNENVKAVILVHFAGYVNREIDAIKTFCDEKGLFLIEDCAQAFLCKKENKRVGTIGDAGTFSFQTSKMVTAGEGGAILTNNETIARKCEAVSNWGLSRAARDRDFTVPSSNFRLSGIQSYLIDKQLQHVDSLGETRVTLYRQMENVCLISGAVAAGPPPVDGLYDYPFFFPVQSSRKINTIEPRPEYPMRNSVMVRTIINTLFPDLLEIYERCNPKQPLIRNSNKVLEQIDFIYIRDCDVEDLVSLFAPYQVEPTVS